MCEFGLLTCKQVTKSCIFFKFGAEKVKFQFQAGGRKPKSSLVVTDLYLEIPSADSLTNSSSKVPLFLAR